MFLLIPHITNIQIQATDIQIQATDIQIQTW